MPNIEIVIAGIIILAATIVISKLRKKNKKKQANIVLAAAVFLLLSVVGVALMTKGVIKFGEEPATVSHQNEYLTIAAAELANYLNGKYPSSKVVIIAKKNYLNDPRQMAIISGLKKRFSLLVDDEDLVVDYLEPIMEGDKEKPISATHFNNFIRKQWYGELYVSIVDLPPDAATMKIWAKDDAKRPNFAVFAGEKNPPAEKLLEEKLILAIVFPKKEKLPDAAPEADDPEGVFKSNFTLLTSPED